MIWRPQKAIILKDGKILLLKRSEDTFTHPGTWDLPGGKIDEGEDPLETVVREVSEETSLVVVPGQVLHSFSEIYKDKLIVVSVYEIISWSGDVCLSDEHTEYRWAIPDEIPTLECWPYLYQLNL